MALNELAWLGVLGLIIYSTGLMSGTQIREAVKSYLLIAAIFAVLFVIGYWFALGGLKVITAHW